MNARCQCGFVHFVTPIPQPLAVYVCHCLECRAQSSSAFGTSAIFPSFELPVTDPPIGVYTRLTETGRTMDCYFCPKCGARVIHAGRAKKVLSVKGGCLEDLSWEDAVHIWTKRAVVPIPKSAKVWEEEPEDE